MRTPNLKFILETILEDQPTPMNRDEKQQFHEEVANFSALGESIYGKNDLEEIVERVKNIVDRADRIMTESDTDNNLVGMKKIGKRMFEDYRDFEQSARELKEAQQRMSMCYENIGQHLSKYFDVN